MTYYRNTREHVMSLAMFQELDFWTVWRIVQGLER